jgi:hypothetical protein
MIEIYYNLVKAGKRTIEQVPNQFKAQVEALLMEREVN